MAKINVKSSKAIHGRTTNYEGGEAFILSPKSALVHLTSTCMFKEPKFYGELGETEQKIFDAVDKVAKEDPKFILQLASYLRNEQYLRTIPMVLLAKASQIPACKPFVKEYTPKIIQRADEINEVIAAYIELFAPDRTLENPIPIKLPNSLKKGIRDSFKNFDQYQYSKYNRKTKVRFKDAIMLTHPKDPSELIKKILDDDLGVPYDWETELSTKGNKPEVWEQLIDSRKMGYFAIIRNLRNILTTGGTGVSDEHINKLIEYIIDPQRVRKSRLFPFRFFSAYLELKNERPHRRSMWRFDEDDTNTEKVTHPRTAEVLDALEQAIMISYENIPHLKGTTLIACDVSGSMEKSISKNSKLQRFDIGLLLGAATHKYTDKGIIGIFGDDWKQINLAKASSGIIANTLEMHRREGEVGYSTNAYEVIEWMINKNLMVDRILFFTDEQFWDSKCSCDLESNDMESAREKYNEYKKINPNVKMYVFDLAGYGTVAFPPSDRSIVGIAGWSEKVLQFIQTYEIDPQIQIRHIEENF